MATRILDEEHIEADPAVLGAREVLQSNPDGSGLFFDFDGVLSRIQSDPETVQPLRGVVEALRHLVPKYRTVAILSSRPASFLHERFGTVDGLSIFGLYGLESIGEDGAVEVAESAKGWQETAAEALKVASESFEETNVWIEDKGLSVGLHYRNDPARQSTVEEWAYDAGKRWGFKVQPGRMAVELKPNLAIDKGTTLADKSSKLSAVWYCGDDTGDLPAMRHLADRRNRDSAFHGLSIGVGNDTIVDAVFETSDVFVDSPETLLRLVKSL